MVPFSQIVCIHCHQQSESACLRSRGGANTVFLLCIVHGACQTFVSLLMSLFFSVRNQVIVHARHMFSY